MQLSRVAPSSCCSRLCRPRTAVIRAASAADNGSSLAEGTKVQVTADVKVFHAPKQPAGVSLKGMQGTVVKNVAVYKDKNLSPNLPYKVQFELDNGGSPVKLIAHLSEDEMDVVA